MWVASRTTTSGTIRIVAAVAAGTLLAVSCGGDDAVVSMPAATTSPATTTQPTAPETTTTRAEGLVADAGVIDTQGTGEPATTTPAAGSGTGESAATEEEAEDRMDADGSDSTYEDADASVTTEPADEPEPEEQLVTEPELGPELDSTPDEPVAEPEPEQQEPQMEDPAAADGTGNTTNTEDTTSTEPESAPGTSEEPPTTTVASEIEPASEQQPEEDAASVIVCSRDASGVLKCPQEIPDDYRCESNDEGMVCHPLGTQPEQPQEAPEQPQGGTSTDTSTSAWTPPVAGAVPDVHPDTPQPEWVRQNGVVDPDHRAYDYPRLTHRTLAWAEWCNAVWDSCRWLMHEMYQALDYLGADPQCVLGIYTQRVNYYLSKGAAANSSYATDTFGWHLCSTVIDPIEGDLPTDRPDTDVGYRLSDRSGITLSERCRIVLTNPFPDIQLERRPTFGELRDGVEPTRFGQDCDAWATYVLEKGLSPSSPACNESSSLAEEWMEHHHNQPEVYFRPHC
ncbi:MAG: hypothetical protein OXH67_14505 [Acidimicrobiaceae bacterium]|nr:hypothetical protein [Acidimicrobiaceae bacterium]